MIFYLIFDYVYIAVMIIIAFGLVILFHEFGHFVVAKLSGVEAPEFAFGMGPELFGFNAGGTRYKVCLFPIGGYVKMVGEDEAEPGELDVPRERNFQYKSTPVKVGIIVAGPVMNIILGFILFASIVLFWGVERGVMVEELSNRTIVELADPRKPAGKAGIKRGDSILTADGVAVKSTAHFSKLIGRWPGRKVEIDVLRGGKRIRISTTRLELSQRTLIQKDDIPLSVDGIKAGSKKHFAKLVKERSAASIELLRDGGKIHISVAPGINPTTNKGEIGVAIRAPDPREIQSVTKGGPAWNAGLRKGDVILDFNGEQFLEDSYSFEGSVQLLVFKAGEGTTKSVTVESPEGGGRTELGAALYPMMEKVGFFRSVVYGARLTGINMVWVAKILYWLVSKKVSTKDVAGPIGIIQYSAYFARTGLRDFIYFFAFISVNLAVLNLIPFPALDGSRIAIHTWEGIRGRPLDARRVGIVHYAGFIFLISLLVLITMRDILHLVH